MHVTLKATSGVAIRAKYIWKNLTKCYLNQCIISCTWIPELASENSKIPTILRPILKTFIKDASELLTIMLKQTQFKIIYLQKKLYTSFFIECFWKDRTEKKNSRHFFKESTTGIFSSNSNKINSNIYVIKERQNC